MTKNQERIAVIGAGMAGLAAARALQEAGRSVTVWEQSATVGGRISTRAFTAPNGARVLFDDGAQNVKSDGTALGEAVAPLQKKSRVVPIAAPVCLHENGRILPGDEASNAARKWSCRDGLAQLPQSFAEQLDVRLNASISALRENIHAIDLLDANGDALDTASHVIVTAPAPQAADLLDASVWHGTESERAAPERIALLRGVEYSRCLSVLLFFAASCDDASNDASWYALLACDREHPLLWLARENLKGFVPHNKGTALVAQLGHAASTELWDESDARIAAQTARWIAEIMGQDFASAEWSGVTRWPHSHPFNAIDFEAVNPVGARVLVCGDGTARGRVPDAYESGLKAARRILSFT